SLENADERYSKMKGKKEEFEGQLKTANDTIADLKKNNTDNETLQNTIKDHEATIATLQKEAETKDFNYALDAVLKDNKCKNSKALKALLNMEGIKLNEGKFEGLEEQLKTLKESDSYLFDAGEKQPGGSGFNPDDEVDDGKNESIGTRLGKQAKESKNTFDDNPYFKI
ncbi:phage scaffolding protein, partial [Terrisporobacter sp.]